MGLLLRCQLCWIMELKLFLLVSGILLYLPLVYSLNINGIQYCQINPPWVKFQGNCYLFHQDWKARVSFYDAEDECRARGGHLASIHSEEENNFFILMAESGVFRARQWIGLNILKGNHSPEWTDGTPVNYTKIVPKEFYKNEKCFMFLRDKKGWRPEHCGLHYPAICKRPANITPTTVSPPTSTPLQVGHCPKDWIQYGEKCYKYFGKDERDRLDFKQARDACWALGPNHDIVSIHSMKEQAFLTQHLYDFGTSAWIGIQKLESDEIGHDIVFGWVDNSRSDFTNWASGNPPPGTWKYCTRLSYEDVSKGEWIADYCELDKKGYICQTKTDPYIPEPVPEPAKCDHNSVGYRNSCYRYFSMPQTHADAEESCKKIGGHLVSILDGFEQSFLHNFIPDSKIVWTGLASVQGTQYLKWSDGQRMYYSNWADDQPKLNKEKKACTFLDVPNGFKWNVTDCSLQLSYVCEISNETSPSYPEVLGHCPNEESSLIDIGDGYCYYVGESKSHILSWDSNLRYCISKGTTMIKTTSEHQIKSLISYLWKENYGINLGMIRKFNSNSYMWIDGSPMTYTNWGNKEPSNYPEDRGCVAFSQKTGNWFTIPCTTGGLVVCQAPKIKNW